jgi:thioredoxin-dependent peroxiredoxin
MKKKNLFIFALVMIVISSACVPNQTTLTFDTESVLPGSSVSRKGENLYLTGNAVKIGHPIPPTPLVDARTKIEVSLTDYQGKVLLLSIVPSIDTRVCEAQTHYLGEEGDVLPPTVQRITISRDTPFAQMRFAKEGDLEHIIYLSDYKEGSFGRSLGLLLEDSRLLARSVILVDKKGVVRHIQVVPEITHLPDMEKAFAKAKELANEK